MTQKQQQKLHKAVFEAKADYKPYSEVEHFSDYFEHGFKVGGLHVIDHPERYDLITQDKTLQSLKEKRVQLARVKQRLSILVGVLKEMDEYLSDNTKNYIGSGSKLHQKIQEVLK